MRKVLIIDDSATMLIHLRDILANEGFDVLEASDGEDALRVFDQHRNISLIVCDYNMPKLDGLSTLKLIFQKCDGPKIPVLMVTTENSKTLKNEARKIGIAGWVVKPIDPDSFIVGVRAVLDKWAKKQGSS